MSAFSDLAAVGRALPSLAAMMLVGGWPRVAIRSIVEIEECEMKLRTLMVAELEAETLAIVAEREEHWARIYRESMYPNPLPRGATHPRVAALEDVIESYIHRLEPDVEECQHCLVNAGVWRHHVGGVVCEVCAPHVRLLTLSMESSIE